MTPERLLDIVASLESEWLPSANVRRALSEKSVAETLGILASRYDALRAAAVEMSGYLHAELI